MQKILFLAICLCSKTIFAQDTSYSQSGKDFYQELPDPAKTQITAWSNVRNDLNVSFASDNVRYPKKSVPLISPLTIWNAIAWKGEKVHTQILVWTKKDIPALSFQVTDLVNEKGQRIRGKNIEMGFVRYVMTDEFGRGCDERKPADYDASLVADPIDIIKTLPVQANTAQPLWISIRVPGDVPAGKYSGAILINTGHDHELKISLNVLNHLLPSPEQWKFDLDLWQSAVSIAKVHDVKLWSDEHFELMKPYFTLLATAGQKTITANIINQPWGPTHVYYPQLSLINWIKRKDGTWSYDYSLFDRYISLVMSCGINQRINCYSMVTWDLSFIYFDEASGKETSILLKLGTPEYAAYWATMLKDFTRHLKEKGWFSLTAIAMDERPVESMLAVIEVLKQIDPAWKIALAGRYHPEIEKDIYDYCVIIGKEFPDEVFKLRKAQGKPTTFYTACGEQHPNAFTYSPPAEMVWLSWYAASAGFTGYLRWAYNDWQEKPLLDSRFRTWPAGDCYQIYPGPRSSLRFEKLIEGIQDFEKIRILKEQFIKEGKEESRRELDEILAAFKPENLERIPAVDMVSKAKELLNKY
jgi:hypothetical protein